MRVDKRWALTLLGLLAGCETTVEVQGMLGESETLTGSLTQYSDGGTIELFGEPKTHCLGNFSYRRIRNVVAGQGMMLCDDRRSGPFRFTMTERRHGSGTGTLNGIDYSFRF
jgi:hypothetical protein